MAAKVYIGKKNGRMGAWVAGPGVDAAGETGRMILDSDLDHLKLHQSGRAVTTSEWAGSRYIHFALTISFTALAYQPLIFLGIEFIGATNAISYPPGIGYVSGDLFADIQPKIFSDRIEIAQFYSDVEHVGFAYHVFENRLTP